MRKGDFSPFRDLLAIVRYAGIPRTFHRQIDDFDRDPCLRTDTPEPIEQVAKGISPSSGPMLEGCFGRSSLYPLATIYYSPAKTMPKWLAILLKSMYTLRQQEHVFQGVPIHSMQCPLFFSTLDQVNIRMLPKYLS